MKKTKYAYACIECGLEVPKWMGKCTRCGSWGSFKKIDIQEVKGNVGRKQLSKVRKVKSVKGKPGLLRVKTRFLELDRVLGGGIVKGEVVLLGGEPGIGKTTLLLQVLDNIVSNSEAVKCVYVTSEESLEQISMHIERLGLSESLDFVCDDDIDSIIATIKDKKYSLAIIDSIQTVKTKDLKGLPGGVGQVKECTSRLVELAKGKGVAVFLVGHITKGGDLAGPKVLEHLVDAVFYLEGDSASNIRLLRGLKNRYGSTKEIGIFNFNGKGFSDAKNPSEIFISSKDERIGVCKGIIFEGNRALLVEIQALISKCAFNLPQRVVSGVKKAKVQMLCAILSKYSKVNLFDKDVYVNIAKGLKVDDSSLDLSICMALLSSYFNKKASPLRVAIGEASLTGQIHAPGLLVDRLKVLKRLGYRHILVPKEAGSLTGNKEVIFVDSVASLVDIL